MGDVGTAATRPRKGRPRRAGQLTHTPIWAWGTPEEADRVARAALVLGMTVSAFMREAGLARANEVLTRPEAPDGISAIRKTALERPC